MEQKLKEKLQEAKQSIKTVGCEEWYIVLTKKEIEYLLSTDSMYKEALTAFVANNNMDECERFLSSYGSGLAKHLQNKGV